MRKAVHTGAGQYISSSVKSNICSFIPRSLHEHLLRAWSWSQQHSLGRVPAYCIQKGLSEANLQQKGTGDLRSREPFYKISIPVGWALPIEKNLSMWGLTRSH